MVKKAFHNALLIQIIAAVVGVIGMVVDGAVTGSCLGTEAMTGFGLASPVVMIFVACSGVCELGSSILIGGLVGARKEKEASVALSSCLAFALGFSLLLSGAVLLFSRQIAAFLGASGSLTDATADYLKGFSLCAPALFMLTSSDAVCPYVREISTILSEPESGYTLTPRLGSSIHVSE